MKRSPLSPAKEGADELRAVSADRILWLFGILVAGLALVVGLKVLFSGFYVQLEQRGANERSRLLIGDEIVRSIGSVETAVYRLALADNAGALHKARLDIDKQLDKLAHDLLVLRDGGTVRRVVLLNIEGRDEMMREFTYHPGEDESLYVMEVIEISPLLDAVRRSAGELEQLLRQRWQLLEQREQALLYRVEEEIAVFAKNIPALFFRLNENANRLLFDSNDRLRKIESALLVQREHFRIAEWLLIGLVVTLTIVTGWVLVRQTRETNRRLRLAWEEMRQAKEEAERASRAKSDFVSRMSHELRTPLNAILGFARLLDGEPLRSSHKQYVRLINQSGQHLLELINQVLDMAKIEAGKMTLERITFDFRQAMKEVQEIVSQRAAAKGLQFVASIPADLPVWVTGDPTRLRQVLINLLANAIKFTPVGSVALEVRPAEERIDFSVRDTGIGMDEAARDRLFVAFGQGDESITRKYGGTGLGLIISRELVQAMGGQIAVDSTPGIGTCFRFSIPLPPAAPPADSTQAASEEQDAAGEESLATLVGGRILLVDDNEINQMVAGAMIERLGLPYDTAADGIEALARLDRMTYQLVLMDMEMPEMDGLAATRELRAREAGCGRHTVVIAMTANALQGDRERCLQAGMDGYVAKPIALEGLASEVRRVLHAARQAARAPQI